jgi:two-component system response regulator RegA
MTRQVRVAAAGPAVGSIALNAGIDVVSQRGDLAAVTRLLLVDDGEVFRERLARAFRERGFAVRTAGNYDDAMASAREHAPQLAVIDLRMPGRGGLELLRELKQLDPSIHVLVLTGYGSIATAVEAVRLGAINYLPKPADADDILAAFRRAGTAADEPATGEAAPTLARAEWEHIHRVMADCGGNISEAARRLGIHRRSLQRKLRKRAPT